MVVVRSVAHRHTPSPLLCGLSVNVPVDNAVAVFGERLSLASTYADLLATTAVERGLIGPREAGRLWQRHILNCAVVQEWIPEHAEVVDIGSGAGLPGLVLAIARPDLEVTLVEPLLRRANWLSEAVELIGLSRVVVVRDRAESMSRSRRRFDVVTARAVAPLPKLAGWCLPLLRSRGALLAMKGSRADEELAAAEPDLAELGGASWSVVTCGSGIVEPLTTVVKIVAS